MGVFKPDRDHARALEAFNTEFGTSTPPLDVLERRFAWMLERDEVIVLVGGDPETPTGFALVTLRSTPYTDGPRAVLDELYVVPGLRGQGRGTELVQAMVEELVERHCGEVHIKVDEQDCDTRRFYEAHQFSNLQNGTDERMLCCVRDLSSARASGGVGQAGLEPATDGL